MHTLLLFLLAGCPGPDAPIETDTDTTPDTDTDTDTDTAPPAPALLPLGHAFNRPVDAAVRPGTDTLYVVEKAGRIKPIGPDGLPGAPFLAIPSLVLTRGMEQGLLGLAFPPDHATTGRFYVHYTRRPDGASVVARGVILPGETLASADTLETLLVVDQPYENHNAGHLTFGPDGLLYVGYGDGGLANDPQGNGQNAATLLGGVLRLDVSGDGPYAVPADNPFAAGQVRGEVTPRPELWATGLRNPWSLHFDTATGDLWIADVGQDAWEEIDRQPAASVGGENYGWSVMEGTHCRTAGCTPVGVSPVYEYPHGPGCSITGGVVYRGTLFPELVGQYVFSDFCSGAISSLALANDGTPTVTDWTAVLDPDGTLLQGVATIAADAAGELVFVNLGGGDLLTLGTR